jgi:hypothetical protein
LATAEWHKGSVREDAREITILAEVDVVVAGGGMSGYAAAIAAARTGATTMLLESSGFLGGLLTACLAERGMYENDENGKQIIAGIWEETKQRLIALDASPGTLRFDGPFYGPSIKVPPSATHTPFDAEMFKYVVAEQVQEAGARILLHAMIVGVVKEGPRVRGILVEGKSGRFAVLGKVIVDCTGDVDVGHAAGVPCQKGRESDGLMMGSSLHFHVQGVQPGPLWDYVQTHPEDVPRWARLVPVAGGQIPPHLQIMGFACHGFQQSMQAAKARGELYFTNGELGIQPLPGLGHVEVNVTKVDVDGTDINGLTTAQLETRKQAVSIMKYLRAHIPGFQAAYISQTAPEIQCRETRRIVGDFVMTVDAMLDATRFDDAVAKGSYPVEVHVPETGQREWQVADRAYQIPYRTFHPTGVDNLIVGSARSLSVTQAVGAALRVCPIPVATGQAAGLAAALSARQGITPARLDPSELRQQLSRQGAIVD